MMEPVKPKRKLQIAIDEELYAELDRILPHGSKRTIVTALLEDLIKQHTRIGPPLLGGILSGTVGVGWKGLDE